MAHTICTAGVSLLLLFCLLRLQSWMAPGHATCAALRPRAAPGQGRIARTALGVGADSAGWRAPDTYLPVVREGVTAVGGGDTWAESAQVIADATEVDVEEAERALAKAFGWKAWAEMNRPKYLKPTLPAPGPIRRALQWLAMGPLGFGPAEVRAALVDSPKVYLGDPATAYAAALEMAPEPFDGPTRFKELLLREPSALKLSWNCELTDPAERNPDIHCDGKCVNCWRTAKPRLMGQVLDGVEV